MDKTTNKQKKPLTLKANFFFNLTIQITTYIISLGTAPYLSRVLGATGIGDYSFALSIVNYFMIAVTFGFRNYGTQKIAKEREDKQKYSNTFWSIFISRFILFSICFSTYFLMAYFGGFGDKLNRTLSLILSINIFTNFIDTTYFYQAMENFKALSIITLVFKIIYAILIFTLVKTINNLNLYAILSVGYTLLTAIFQWFFVFRFLKSPNFSELHIFKTLKEGFIYFLPTIAITIYTSVDKTMIGLIKNTTEVAYYEQAYKIVYMVISLLFALGTVILPRMSYLYKKNEKEKINSIISKMASVYALLSFPCVAGLYALSNIFIPTYFGNEFIPSINVMYAMIPLIFLMPLSNYIDSAFFLPNGKVKQSTIFYYIAAILNFLLNLLTIKYLGALGAALSSSFTECVLVILFIIFSKKFINYSTLVKKIIKPFVASLIMFGIVFAFIYLESIYFPIGNILTCIIATLLGVITYVILLILLKEENTILVLKKLHHNKFKK